MKSAAIAVFVKTPGLSPVKSRLAATLGKDFAESFFLHSTEYLKNNILSELSDFDVYWAVAEKEGIHYWKGFKCLYQGESGLGDRLACINEQLAEYPHVFLIGADSPMIRVEEIQNAYTVLKEGSDFVIGPTFDGGFYLYGSRTKVPKEIWTKIAYSNSETKASLEKVLIQYGKVSMINKLLDIDTNEDLQQWLQQRVEHPVIQKIKEEYNIIYTTLNR